MNRKCNAKSGISTYFKYNDDLIKDPDQITNALCDCCTDVGQNHVNANPVVIRLADPSTGYSIQYRYSIHHTPNKYSVATVATMCVPCLI